MLKISALGLAFLALTSCQKEVDKTKMMLEEASLHKSNYKEVHFETNTDVVCGMKLSMGISDTVQYNGKNYGFCCQFCKADFQQNPKKYTLSTIQTIE